MAEHAGAAFARLAREGINESEPNRTVPTVSHVAPAAPLHLEAVATAVHPSSPVAEHAGAAIARLAREGINESQPNRTLPAVRAASALRNASLHLDTVSFNLGLSDQWMFATANTSAISRVVVNASASYVPEYRSCGQVMNYAWRQAHDSPCTEPAYQAADRMRDAVPRCSQLRQGEAYRRSYRELLDDQDAWCGKPQCVPRCVYEDHCKRDFNFPHEPMCYGAGVDPCNKTAVGQPQGAAPGEGGITTDAKSRSDVGRYEEPKVKPWFMKHGTLGKAGTAPTTTTQPAHSGAHAAGVASLVSLLLSAYHAVA